MLPPDFDLQHTIAIALLFGSLFSYSALLSVLGRGTLNSQLTVVRQHWIAAMTRRDAKPFDAVLLGHIINSIAFFGSATMIVLAGVITLFASVKNIHETMSQLQFIAQTSLELFALQIGLLGLILAISFFSFTYALRKLIYTITLVGALPDKSENCPTHDVMVTHAAKVLSETAKTFNFGIRGYYYSVASLCLFISPLACMAATVLVTAILILRQLVTPTARAIEDYVEAAKYLGQK